MISETLTPLHIKWPRRREILAHSFERRPTCTRPKGGKKGFQCGGAKTEKNKNVRNQKFMISHENAVVKGRKRIDRVCLLGDEEQNQWDEQCENRCEYSR